MNELAEALDVLVVDDERGVRELLVGYFSARHFRVTGAPDGGAAIAMLQRACGRFGLVVTDLNLPGADGFAVLQAARQVNPDCFVVIITGYASLDSAIHAVRVGACDYLTKPFSLGQLDVILSRILDRHRHSIVVEARPAGQGQPVPVAARVAPWPVVDTMTVDAEVIVDAEVVTADTTVPRVVPGASTSSIDQRLGQLEAAFGRIEALLRTGR